MIKMDTSSTKYKKLLCVIGSTATGKTDIALHLAKIFDGELVSCDSRQVYKGLDLGSGKEPSEESVYSKNDGYWLVNGVPIWMYDVASPDQQYSVAHYIKDASKKIDQIIHKRKLPIVVGGTGFYLDGLLYGNTTASVMPDELLRKELETLSIFELQQRLFELDPEVFKKLNQSDKNNPRRLIRKIEIGLSSNKKLLKGIDKNITVLKIGLKATGEALSKRINERVIKRVHIGMIDEAIKLHQNGLSYERMRQLGLEYRVMADFLDGVIVDENEFIMILQQKIRQYAKRQITWFQRDKEINWFDVTDVNFFEKVEKMVQDWYNPLNE